VSARGPIKFDQALYDYTLANWLRDDDIKRRLRERTAQLSNAGMQISPDQGQLMALLARSIGARLALEVGVFTGYSALCVAEALPADGKLIACDISEEYTSIGKPFWREAGVTDRIDLRIGPAVDTLHRLLGEGRNGTFDFAFIDADKSHYNEYYEACLQLLRSGGLVLIDNVLWGGSVANAAKRDADTDAIRELNATLHQDRRIDLALVPIGDGLTVARKR
jgi:predicted O-methyltransferase YrrM